MALKLDFSSLQRERGEGGHLATPGHGLPFDFRDWKNRIDESHVERLLRVVEAGEEPDLLRLLDTHVPLEEGGAEAAVEAPDARPGLAEDGVVPGDRQVADEMEDVPAPDGVALDHRHHRLRQPADLNMEVADVEPADSLLGDLVVADVAVVAANPLIAAGTERLVARAGEDDRRDLGVVTGPGEGVAELRERRRPECVVNLRPVDRDLRDRIAALVEDVLVVALGGPLDRGVELILGRGVLVASWHGGNDSQARIS